MQIGHHLIALNVPGQWGRTAVSVLVLEWQRLWLQLGEGSDFGAGVWTQPASQSHARSRCALKEPWPVRHWSGADTNITDLLPGFQASVNHKGK